MPAYCAPWPVNRNATFGGSARSTCRALRPVAPRHAESGKCLGGRGAIGGDQGEAVGEVAAAGAGGEGDVGQVGQHQRLESARSGRPARERLVARGR